MGPYAKQKLEQLESLRRSLANIEGKLRMVDAFKQLGTREEIKSIIRDLESGIIDLTERMVQRNATDEDRRELAAEIRVAKGLIGVITGKKASIDQLRRDGQEIKRQVQELERALGPAAQQGR